MKKERIFKTIAKRRYHFRQWPMKINIICSRLRDTTHNFVLNTRDQSFERSAHTYTHTLTASPFSKCKNENKRKTWWKICVRRSFLFLLRFFFLRLVLFSFILSFTKRPKNQHSQTFTRTWARCEKSDLEKSPTKKNVLPKSGAPANQIVSTMYCHEI